MPVHYLLCETFHNGGLARSRFAYQQRAVFVAAVERVDDLLRFVFTTDNRIEFTPSRFFGKIESEFFENSSFYRRELSYSFHFARTVYNSAAGKRTVAFRAVRDCGALLVRNVLINILIPFHLSHRADEPI